MHIEHVKQHLPRSPVFLIDQQRVQDNLRSRGYAEVGHIVEFFGVAPQASRATAATVPVVR